MFSSKFTEIETQACCALVVVMMLSTTSFAQPSAYFDKQILAIYGTGGIATWEQRFNATFFSELGASTSTFIDPEFLSLIQATDQEEELYARSLQLKYSNREFDLVMAVLPEANSFVLNWKHLFAPNADIIHVLPNLDTLNSSSDGTRAVTLRTAAGDAVEKTVELVPSLLPNLDKAYVVSGIGEGDKFYIRYFKETLASLDMPFEVEFLEGLTPDELLQRLSSAAGNSAVLMSTYDLDHTGAIQRTISVTTLLSEELDMPVFGFVDTLPPIGSIGGNMAITENYAIKAAELARDAFNGDFPETSVTAETRYIFNGVKLDQFGINRRLLPEGSLIVNDTSSLWREYYLQVITALVVIAFLLVIVVLLINAIRMRKTAEQELLKAHKKDALGSLASGVAHDFNNILMSISANTELASFESNNTVVRERLANVLAASNRAKNLVKQILMFSRPATEEFVTIDVRRIIEESVGQLRVLFGEKNSIVYVAPRTPMYISADSTQIHQIIMNVCINAQHAMPNGGKIEIVTSHETLSKPVSILMQKVPIGDYIKIQFIDSGLGIEFDNLGKVFEPFFTTKPSGEGTGLGLALVLDIVKRHHAYVDIQSTLDQGTNVSFYFPAVLQSNHVEDSRSSNSLIEGENQTILLVEDDDMVRIANKQLLERLKFIVIDFARPNEALEFFRDTKMDITIVLSDFSMPQMDGVQLVERIREISPNQPAVIYTGYLNDLGGKHIENCQILQKPIEIAELSRALNASLNVVQ